VLERPRVAEELKSDSVTRTRPGDVPAAGDRSSPAAKAATDTSTAGDSAETLQERANRTGSAPPATVSAREHVLVTRRIKNDASRLTEQSFAKPSDLQTHRKAVATLETAAKSLEDKARRLQPLDFAAAEFQIDHASRVAARVNSAATAGQVIGGAQVEAVQRAARTVEPIAKRIAAGQRPLPVRWVSVRVGQKETADEVKGLQVYVLPGAVLDEPALYSASDIRKLLTHFSFTGLTSPAVQELAVFDTRVWVGPRMKYDEMVELVGQGKLKKFRVIDKPTVGDAAIELTFVAPDDLVQP
jgi:hypothetical protein